jgi:hypothetical protein
LDLNLKDLDLDLNPKDLDSIYMTLTLS